LLIGAHVSTAGGLSKTVGRGVERDCEAIQIFHQSPRMWRPTKYSDDDYAEFRAALADSPIESVVIHAVYLINPATKDKEMRKKSTDSLVHALRMGDEIGADGVVLHPGSTVGEPADEALGRVGDMVKHALSESEGCRLLLENTAGAGNTLGRTFEELRELIDLAGGDKRIGVCLDSCHMFATGFDITTADKVTEVVDHFKKTVGIRRLRCLHVNDSLTPLGSNRDRHAIPGDGEIGTRGCAAFLSEPRFEKLPALFEGPGTSGHAPDKVDVDKLKKLRAQGLRSRKRRG
jgi:deoxyribonuclease IV